MPAIPVAAMTIARVSGSPLGPSDSAAVAAAAPAICRQLVRPEAAPTIDGFTPRLLATAFGVIKPLAPQIKIHRPDNDVRADDMEAGERDHDRPGRDQQHPPAPIKKSGPSRRVIRFETKLPKRKPIGGRDA